MPGILYPESFSSNLLGTHVEMAVLAELLHKKLSRLSEHLKAMHCDISIISTDYFLCLYCTALPSEVRLDPAAPAVLLMVTLSMTLHKWHGSIF